MRRGLSQAEARKERYWGKIEAGIYGSREKLMIRILSVQLEEGHYFHDKNYASQEFFTGYDPYILLGK